MAHIHAELMKQYAEDAANYDEPRKLWQKADFDGQWMNLAANPSFNAKNKYRRKLTKPNPLKEKPLSMSAYFIPDIISPCMFREYTYYDDDEDNMFFDRNIMFISEEDAINCTKWMLEKLKE